MKNSITGKVIAIGERRVAQDKSWAVDSFVVEETGTEYPDSMVLDVFSTRERPLWQEMALVEGEVVTAHYDTKAKESNGRYFNSIKCWRVERPAASEEQSKEQPIPAPAPVISQDRMKQAVDILNARSFEVKQEELPF